MSNAPSPSMPDLARQLLALEAANNTTADPAQAEAVRVLEKLRGCVFRLAGPDGSAALLQRSLALARADFPSLRTVRVIEDGRLDGLEELLNGAHDGGGADIAVSITSHLLGLLMTFIGEPLTLRLVRETWPALPDNE